MLYFVSLSARSQNTEEEINARAGNENPSPHLNNLVFISLKFKVKEHILAFVSYYLHRATSTDIAGSTNGSSLLLSCPNWDSRYIRFQTEAGSFQPSVT